MSIDLTGKNKFAWFVLHAEAESGVVEGFKVQGAVQPGGPTVAGGSGTFTLAVVRARSKPTYAIIDDIEEEELLGTRVHGWGQAVAKHNGMFSIKKNHVYGRAVLQMLHFSHPSLHYHSILTSV